jgi:hypothetical protein
MPRNRHYQLRCSQAYSDNPTGYLYGQKLGGYRPYPLRRLDEPKSESGPVKCYRIGQEELARILAGMGIN